MDYLKLIWCALHGHGGMAATPDPKMCRCKKCGATVRVWPWKD